MASFYLRELSLQDKLQQLADEVREYPLTVGEGLSRIAAGTGGYGILLLLLSLPGALPMPAIGLNSPLGVIVMLLGVQVFFGKHSPWLPGRFTRVQLRPAWCSRAAHLGNRFLSVFERFIKPRINWMKYHPGTVLLGVTVFVLGFLMLLPIPGTNTLPALVLLSLSIGLIESDGLITLLAVIAALVLLVLYAEIVYLLTIWLI